ncbi:potassium channel family protein [Humibacillus xanthopallidus]|uniref:Voltage-gated potassium channel n=1 Tax=Humibacillus xanthopallidus TaxID=412689 RepID=A0A543HTC2_9MICO|nr:potassium channel protein [Humibacillus xanthopallidus]TQM57555.1 voltage-gated potassium channel [Humibacillus xanthopallidus]TQM61603.1 voltage-gated potassium channel [Humibacillus xanthopallidus]
MRAAVKRVVAAPFRPLTALPIVKRITFHLRRISGDVDLHFFRTLLLAVIAFVFVAAFLVTVFEVEKRSLHGLGDSFYWAVTTVIGSGDPSYVNSAPGFVIGWLLAFFGVAIVAALTAALVGFVIDYLLKEGQGMGAAGYENHIVVCGWNATARELIEELRGDEFTSKIVLVHDAESNPAGMGVYFVRGDVTNAHDLERAGIEQASAAIVFPADGSNEADMRSILAVLAIESLAPAVRTVVEVNNPKHVEHFERAHADEILVTSTLASRLLARSALYPGLAELVTDIVSGGDGSELYRVALPDDYVDLTTDELSARLRQEHEATLLAVVRDGMTVTNPKTDFRLRPGDDAVVVAESLGSLSPLDPENALERDEPEALEEPHGIPAVPAAPNRWRRAPSAS